MYIIDPAHYNVSSHTFLRDTELLNSMLQLLVEYIISTLQSNTQVSVEAVDRISSFSNIIVDDVFIQITKQSQKDLT